MPDNNKSNRKYVVVRDVFRDAIIDVPGKDGRKPFQSARMSVDAAFAEEHGIPVPSSGSFPQVHVILQDPRQVLSGANPEDKPAGRVALSFFEDKPLRMSFKSADGSYKKISGVMPGELAEAHARSVEQAKGAKAQAKQAGVGPGPDAQVDEIVIASRDDAARQWTLHGRDSVKSIRIAASMKYVGDYLFSACPNLERVVLEPGVESIGKCAFEGCEKLSSIEIPDTVESIGESAFRFCGSLDKPVLPEGVSVGRAAFDFGKNADRSLKYEDSYGAIHVHEMSRHSMVPKDAELEPGVGYKDGKFPIFSMEFPEGMTAMPDMMVQGYDWLWNVKLPASMEYIGPCAFQDCKRLKSVEYSGNPPEVPLEAGETSDRFHPDDLLVYGIDSAGNRVGYVNRPVTAFPGCPCDKSLQQAYAASVLDNHAQVDAEHLALVRETMDGTQPGIKQAVEYSDIAMTARRKAFGLIARGDDLMQRDEDDPLFRQGRAMRDKGLKGSMDASVRAIVGAERGVMTDKALTIFCYAGSLCHHARDLKIGLDARDAGKPVPEASAAVLAVYDKMSDEYQGYMDGPYRKRTIEDLTSLDGISDIRDHGSWLNHRNKYAYHALPGAGVDRGAEAEARLGGISRGAVVEAQLGE